MMVFVACVAAAVAATPFAAASAAMGAASGCRRGRCCCERLCRGLLVRLRSWC